MANFEQAVSRLFDFEGGYQNLKNDSGNYNSLGQLVGTNMGIAAPTLEAYLGYPPSVTDMKAITKATARAIYFESYWQPLRCSEIDNQLVAEIFFDAAAQYGPGTSIRMMQKTLGNVAVDSIMGSQTLSAINAAPQKALFLAFKEARADKYRAIVANNPSQAGFLQGWLNRLKKFVWTGGDDLPQNPPFAQNAGGSWLLLLFTISLLASNTAKWHSKI